MCVVCGKGGHSGGWADGLAGGRPTRHATTQQQCARHQLGRRDGWSFNSNALRRVNVCCMHSLLPPVLTTSSSRASPPPTARAKADTHTTTTALQQVHSLTCGDGSILAIHELPAVEQGERPLARRHPRRHLRFDATAGGGAEPVALRQLRGSGGGGRLSAGPGASRLAEGTGIHSALAA